MYSARIYVLFTSLYTCTVPGFNYTLHYVNSARIQIFILCCNVYNARVQSYCVVLLTCARILFLTTTVRNPGSCDISTCCLECITQQSPCMYDMVPHRWEALLYEHTLQSAYVYPTNQGCIIPMKPHPQEVVATNGYLYIGVRVYSHGKCDVWMNRVIKHAQKSPALSQTVFIHTHNYST